MISNRCVTAVSRPLAHSHVQAALTGLIRFLATTLFTLLVIANVANAAPEDDFVTTWRVATEDSITIPTRSNETYSYTVNWGEGEVEDTTIYRGSATHIYASAGTYTVSISGTFPRIYFNNEGDKDKIIAVNQWGTGQWSSMARAFYGASNLAGQATDVPDLSRVTIMNHMFKDAHNFNQDIGDWDVSKVTRMANVFNGATKFNQDISRWDVSKVTRMANMFDGANDFNQNLGRWFIAPAELSVTEHISVGTQFGMLSAQNTFLDKQNISYTIADSNEDLFVLSGSVMSIKNSLPTTSSRKSYTVTVTAHTPSGFGATTHSRDITIKVVRDPSAFITTWRTTMDDETITIPTFPSENYNYNVDCDGDSRNDWLSQNGAAICTYAVAGMHTIVISDTFPRIYFNNEGDKDKIIAINQWGTGQWTSMARAFDGASNLAGQATDLPDLSLVNNMARMFRNASSFNQDIGDWGVGNVTNMRKMFQGAATFNQDIGGWDVSNAVNMDDMFAGAAAFSQNLGRWYIPSVLNVQEKVAAGTQFATLSAQNAFLNGQIGSYALADAALFTLSGAMNRVMSINRSPPAANTDASYRIRVTARTRDGFGTANSRDITVKVVRNPSAFITIWRTTRPNESITIPTTGRGYYYNVDCDGDSRNDFIKQTGDVTCSYARVGTHTVVISGRFPRIYFNNEGDKNKIIAINQWGTGRWTSMENAFNGTTHLSVQASDNPDLSRVTNMSQMFKSAHAFNQDISGWDVSNVTNMSAMFWDAQKFNQDISDWDVGNVTNMFWMFRGVRAFNQDIGDWDVSAVERMGGMFENASAFNQNISDWDVSIVSGMNNMFKSASDFNQDIDGWDVSSVTNMRSMFAGASAFNQDISGWDVSSVTDMGDMFTDATVFSQNLGRWYITPDALSMTERVAGGTATFSAQNAFLRGQISYTLTGTDASSFTLHGGEISINKASPTANTGKIYYVTVTANGGFGTATHRRNITIKVIRDPSAFVTTWAVGIEPIHILTTGGGYKYDISCGDGRPIIKNLTGNTSCGYRMPGTYTVVITGDFPRIHFNAGEGGNANSNRIIAVNQWGTGRWTSMENAFHGASNLQITATDKPDLSAVTSMARMFQHATAFNGNISTWDVSNVQNMNFMFFGASAFNQDIGGWDVSNVTDMNNMFYNAHAFNQNLGRWFVTPAELNVVDSVSAGAQFATLSAQNALLDSHIQRYELTTDGDAALFALSGAKGSAMSINSPPVARSRTSYRVTVVAHGDDLGQNFGNAVHSRDVEIKVRHNPSAFITTWRTSSANETITIPTYSTATYNYNVDWGDGGIDTAAYTGNATHDYATAGTHTVVITGTFPRVYFNNQGGANQHKIIAVNQWGVDRWTSMAGAFYGATNLVGQATDVPNLSEVTSMNQMFRGAISFDQGLGDWDVSSVTNMGAMFLGATVFNQNISGWNVSSVTDMNHMFADTTEFNQDISGWDVSNVTDMDHMFEGTTEFNQDISGWDVSNVTDMNHMFSRTTVFNQDISGWDVSNVDNMENMFHLANVFNHNLGRWFIISAPAELSVVEYASVGTQIGMLTAQNVFLNGQGPIYTLSSGEDLFVSRGSAISIKNSLLVGFRTSYTVTVTTPSNDFGKATHSRDIEIKVLRDSRPFITTWQTTGANETITIPTEGNGYNYTVNWGDGGTDVATYTGDATHTYATAGEYTVTIAGDFPRFYLNDNQNNKTKIIAINQWGSGRWTSMENAFHGASNLVGRAIDAPNLSMVASMKNMFRGASKFNQDIGGWGVSSVTNMAHMFDLAAAFDQNLGNWDVSLVTDFAFMFGQFVHGMPDVMISTENYEKLLIGWAKRDLQDDQRLNVGTAKYCSVESIIARAMIIASHRWTIEDGGLCHDSIITPTITANGGAALYPITLNENIQSVATITAVGTDGDTLTYSLFGFDSALFNITQSGMLTFKSEFIPDYENPRDADGNIDNNQDQIYFTNVRVTDPHGLSDEQEVRVTIRDVTSEPPAVITLSTTTVTYNAPADMLVGTLSKTGGITNVTTTFALVGESPDNNLFEIDGTELKIKVTPASDRKDYDIRIGVNNGTSIFSATFTITISGINTPIITANGGADPYPITLDENIQSVATITAIDADGDTLTYSLFGHASVLFDITQSGMLTFKAEFIPDYENPRDADGNIGHGEAPLYYTNVRVTDPRGLFDEQEVRVIILDVNETPTITGTPTTTVAEDDAYTFTPEGGDDDVGDTPTYSLSNHPAWLSVDTATGTLSGTPTNADVGEHNDIVLTITSGGESATLTFSITVTNINDEPTGLPIINGTPTQGGTLTVDTSAIRDADGLDTFTYQWQGGGNDIERCDRYALGSHAI